MAIPNVEFWSWLVHTGLIAGDPLYYSQGRAQPAEYTHALKVAIANLEGASDPRVEPAFWEYLVGLGAIQGNPAYYSSGQAQPAEVTHAVNVASSFFVATPGATTKPGAVGGTSGGVTAGGITDIPPVAFGDTTLPDGGRLIKVTNPLGSDAAELFFVAYDWNGVQLTYEIGDRARLNELFGGVEAFDTLTTYNQANFDNQGFTLTGSVDQILGSTESLGSQIEREVRALGLEDLPTWIAGSPQALALVAEAAAQEWSSGRLWESLSNTAAFATRFGGAIGVYQEGGRTIAEAVDQMVADEDRFRAALRTFSIQAGVEITNDYIHSIMANGWTPTAAATVLDAGRVIINNPTALDAANQILTGAGLGSVDEVGLINAMQGTGPPEIVEAINTVFAATALEDAGLGDVDLDLLASVVDTSDRILTADSFAQLAQELSFNLIRFGAEVDRAALGVTEEDIVAAAFGRESPSGRSAGETINLLARFERDRREAASGFDQASGFLDDSGRLVVQGLAGL